ncbi:MAG TPA: cytochrome P450 [Solirubrobacteraceae bacterium]|nr:cytochrome P450 [Solirubrobacteraceae bacterium]
MSTATMPVAPMTHRPKPLLPPGPRMPMLLQSALTWSRTLAFFASAQRKYGPVFTIRSLPWGTAVVVNDTQLVKQIFTGDPAVYHAGDGNSLLAPVLGERSVLVLDEEPHLSARKRLLPPFHGDSVRRYGEIVERIVEEDIERWPIGEPFPLHPRMQAITLEVILEAVIGVTDPARLRALREALPAAVPTDPILMGMWVVKPLEHVGRWRRFRRAIEHANALLREEIAARRLDPQLDEREDVLSQLVRAGETDDEELRDQIMTLLLAGHETTTTGLAWAFERLLRHPEALARAREGDDAYLDAVVQETLRVRPVIPAVLRQLQAPVELGDWRLPAGVTVMPAILLLHNDATLFPEPKRFRPERFLEDGAASTYTWIPFGGGRRRCLGAAFASFEMRVALRTILKRTTLRAERPEGERARNHHITLVPARGASVVREA